MATINDPFFVAKLIRANGHFEDDPRVVVIFSYISAWDTDCYKLFWEGPLLPGQLAEFQRSSPFIREPHLLWTAPSGLSECGKKWIAAVEEMRDKYDTR